MHTHLASIASLVSKHHQQNLLQVLSELCSASVRDKGFTSKNPSSMFYLNCAHVRDKGSSRHSLAILSCQGSHLYLNVAVKLAGHTVRRPGVHCALLFCSSLGEN